MSNRGAVVSYQWHVCCSVPLAVHILLVFCCVPLCLAEVPQCLTDTLLCLIQVRWCLTRVLLDFFRIPGGCPYAEINPRPVPYRPVASHPVPSRPNDDCDTLNVNGNARDCILNVRLTYKPVTVHDVVRWNACACDARTA